MKMKTTKSNAARRAWNILRLTLLWARKGGVLRRRLMLNFPKYIKNLRHNHGGNTYSYRYGERQLSFDDTPVIHVRMHRPSSLRFKLPNIPCINPSQVDFDFDFNDTNDDGFYYDDITRKSFLRSAEEDNDEEYSGLDVEVYGDHESEEQGSNIGLSLSLSTPPSIKSHPLPSKKQLAHHTSLAHISPTLLSLTLTIYKTFYQTLSPMPPAEISDLRRSTKPHQLSGAPPPEPEQLPCPRCDSTNTKFCYYNNYNFSQPRHFCKACRRYWTHGGTLRDIPVGGGSRKNAKRSRPSASIFATSGQDYRHLPATATPIFLPLSGGDHGGSVPFMGDMKQGFNMCGSFTSLLTTQGPGLLTLGGFGLGIGHHGFEDMGFGLGRAAVWPFSGVGDGGDNGGGNVMGNTWQLESGESGFGSGDCFTLPDLAISTPGNGMK